jgi:Holliday junction resolvase
MSNVSRGHGRERDLVKRLRGEGWFAMRAPASLGEVDVLAMRLGDRPRMIEVKSTAAGPYEHFRPADRAELIKVAALAGAAAELCWWPPDGQGPRFIPASDWPGT